MSSADPSRLVLFDIDGTLLLTAGAGRRAIVGRPARGGGRPRARSRASGSTARPIPRSWRDAGGGGAAGGEGVGAGARACATATWDCWPRSWSVPPPAPRSCPAWMPLLDRLEARPGVLLGLLTGNLAEGAALKLQSGGIDPARFRVGAYGSDAAHRPGAAGDRGAPGRAVLRPRPPGRGGRDHRRHAGGHPLRRGDRRPGAGRRHRRRTRWPTSAACGPHAVFEDLSDTDRVLEAILGLSRSTGARAQGRRPRSRRRCARGSAPPARSPVPRPDDAICGTIAARSSTSRDEVLRVRTFHHRRRQGRGGARLEGTHAALGRGLQAARGDRAPVSAGGRPGAAARGAGLPAGARDRPGGRDLSAGRGDRARWRPTPAWTCCSRSRAIPAAIERAVAASGIPASEFTAESLAEFVRRFESAPARRRSPALAAAARA